MVSAADVPALSCRGPDHPSTTTARVLRLIHTVPRHLPPSGSPFLHPQVHVSVAVSRNLLSLRGPGEPRRASTHLGVTPTPPSLQRAHPSTTGGDPAHSCASTT